MTEDELKLIHEMSAFIVNNCKPGKARQGFRNQLLEKAEEVLQYHGKKSRIGPYKQNYDVAGNAPE